MSVTIFAHKTLFCASLLAMVHVKGKKKEKERERLIGESERQIERYKKEVKERKKKE